MKKPSGAQGFVRSLPVRRTLDDPALPERARGRLDEMVRAARERRMAARGGRSVPGRQAPVLALFEGPTGSGKTLAAEAVAGALQVPLYRIDLAQVASKYIGETEKNLAAIFDEAERSGAVLLFDEADALFGKRTDVRDAHDRHANVEVAWLLEKIGACPGVVILAASGGRNLDDAFLRRTRWVVGFRLPRTA